MSDNKYSVKAENVSKCYKMYTGPKQKLMDLIIPNGAGKDFYALKDISFSVNQGDVVGLIGLNGSGKSTLSNIIGGVSMPTKGKINIVGESSLIAIGLGLNNFLTGMENIEVKCIMMGYKKDEIEKIKQEIIDFADIGNFIAQPIRTYSSGMRSRLGFAISVYTNPDVLVIDEALSVGDPTFTQKCLDKMNEFKENGKTIFFVSHSTSQIRQFCNKVIWLEYGALRDYGKVDEILPMYDKYIKFINSMTEHEKKEYKKIVLNHQEHALLSEFKILDPKYKKVKTKGKVLKHVVLINKSNEIKILNYNIDLLIAAFGFIPLLFRGRVLEAAIVLLIQIANILIIPNNFCIVTNFIITIICAFFTGKSYVNYLIENKGYLDFSIWKLNNLSSSKKDILKKCEESLSKRISYNRVISAICLILLIIIPGVITSYKNSGLINNIPTVAEQKDFNSNVAIVLVDTDSEGNTTLSNIGILTKDNTIGKLKIDIYPGEIQIKQDDKYSTLNDVVVLDKNNNLKQIFNENFNIQVSDFIIINTNYEGSYISNDEICKNIKDELIEFLNSDDREFGNEKSKILKMITSLNEKKVVDFYNKFTGEKDVIVDYIKYQEVPLTNFIEREKLEVIGKNDYVDYKIKVFDIEEASKVSLVRDFMNLYDEYTSSNTEENN